MPALLAMASRGDDRFDRATERWIERYRSESSPTPDEREVALARGALSTLPGSYVTATIGAEALVQLLELRGMDYARVAVAQWTDRLHARQPDS